MKWRYKTLEDSGDVDEKTLQHAFIVDGEQDKGFLWAGTLLEVLNQWGSDGWELCAVLTNQETIYIFKKIVG